MFIREQYDAIDFESVTVNSTATGLSSTKLNARSDNRQVIGVLLSVETAAIRLQWNGTTAGTTSHKLDSGSYLELWGGNNVKRLSFIRSATNAAVRVTYYGA